VIQSSQAGRRANASARSSTSTTPSPPQGFVAFQPPASTPLQQRPHRHHGQYPAQGPVQQFLPSRPLPVDQTPPLPPMSTSTVRDTTTGTSMTLMDPLFQDLDRDSRYYLSHCKSLALFCMLAIVVSIRERVPEAYSPFTSFWPGDTVYTYNVDRPHLMEGR
jgi:hypothetical protein